MTHFKTIFFNLKGMLTHLKAVFLRLKAILTGLKAILSNPGHVKYKVYKIRNVI
jgi:hypothetical protein